MYGNALALATTDVFDEPELHNDMISRVTTVAEPAPKSLTIGELANLDEAGREAFLADLPSEDRAMVELVLAFMDGCVC